MMNEKEMNQEILSQLYQVADNIICRLPLKPGAYTANELEKKSEKEGLFAGFEGEENEVNITISSFSCKLAISSIFHFIAKFETFTGITGTKKHLFIIEPENNHYFSKVVVRISSEDTALCRHLNGNGMHEIYRNVCLDIAAKEICATEGHTLEVKRLNVVDASEYDQERTRVVISGEVFAKMCKKAGKKGAELVCTLTTNKENRTVWQSSCCGYVSTVEEYKGVNYHKVVPNVDPLRKVEMDAATWKAAKKWIKTNLVSFGDDGARVVIEHEKNDPFLTLTIKDDVNAFSAFAQFPCMSVPGDSFAICFKGETLATALDQFCLYLPSCNTEVGLFVNSDNIQLRMPMLLPYDIEGYSLPTDNYKANIFDLVSLDKETSIIEPRKNHRKSASKKVETVRKEVKTAKKETDKKKSFKVQAYSKKAASTIKPSQSSKEDKKFSFDKIGLKVGDIIQFIDGTDVLVSDNNMIEFCGEKFTLSGFTRMFVPDDKANKSGAYRGCAYFFYQGVRLDKLLRAALSSKVEPGTTKVEDVEAVIVEPINEPVGEEKKTDKEKTVIIQIKTFTAQEIDKVKVFYPIRRISVHHHPAVPSMSPGQYISDMADWAVMADIPSRGGVAGASSKMVADVGTVAAVGCKVVHELPLPPPRNKAA